MNTNFNAENLRERSILILGLGATGLSVARYLVRLGVEFELADENIDEQRKAELEQMFAAGARVLHTTFSAMLFKTFDLIVASPGIPQSHPDLVAARLHGVQIVGDIDLFVGQTSSQIIAVTGSNGKSTVVAWLGEVLAETDLRSAVAGNIGTPVLELTDQELDIVVLELSSFQLETLQQMDSLSSCVLNVSEDHLDRYESFADYALAKRQIYRGASFVVANANDSHTWPSSDNTSVSPHTDALFSLSTIDDAVVENAASNTGGSPLHCYVAVHAGEEWLYAGNDPVSPVAELKLAGRHNVENALAVIALLKPLELPFAVIRQGLAAFTGLAHRTELVAEIAGVRWYNDSKGTNIDACAKAISGMNAPVVLIAGGLGKGADFTQLRTPVSNYCKALILIGRDAAVLETALADIVSVYRATSMREAVKAAHDCAVSGDVVVLSPACASFDMFDGFVHRGNVFSDEVRRLAA